MGIPPCPPQEEEGEKRKPEARRTGKPPVGEPDAVAPLGQPVAVRLACEDA
jgi:hypothetical protein